MIRKWCGQTRLGARESEEAMSKREHRREVQRFGPRGTLLLLATMLACGVLPPARSAGARTADLSAPPPAATRIHACDPTWQIVPSPNAGTGNNELYGLAALGPDDLWAVGRYSTMAGYMTLALHRDGSEWTIVPTPNVGMRFNQLSAVAAVAPDDVWAVGSSSNEDLVQQTMIQHWDGSAWSVVTSPVAVGSSAFLYGIAALSVNDIWAVGYTNLGTVAQRTLVVHWDGNAWSVVGSPNPSGARDILWGVSAVSATDVWAVGNSSDSTGVRTLIAHWDGAQWSAVPSANGPSISMLWGVEAVSANQVWAMGRTYDGATYPSLMQRWDGTAWSLSPHPDDSFYNELYDAAAVTPDDVWAVGRHGGGFSANLPLITHWDGAEWSVVSHPAPPDSGESFLYSVVAAGEDDVWAVGAYVKDEIRYQTLIEHYSRPCVTSVPAPTSTAVRMTCSPNPAPTRATLRFALVSAGAASLALFDPEGRRIVTLIDRQPLTAGVHQVSLRTEAMKTGVYFARLEAGGRITTSKLLVIR
jgi:hypothetical protein